VRRPLGNCFRVIPGPRFPERRCRKRPHPSGKRQAEGGGDGSGGIVSGAPSRFDARGGEGVACEESARGQGWRRGGWEEAGESPAVVVLAGDPGGGEAPAFRCQCREFLSPGIRGLFKVAAAEFFRCLGNDGSDRSLNASGLVVFAGRPCERVAREVADRIVLRAAAAGRTVEQEDGSEAGNAVGWRAGKLEQFPCLRERGRGDDGVEVFPAERPTMAVGLAAGDFRAGADIGIRSEGAGEPAVAEPVVPAFVGANRGTVRFRDRGGEHGEIAAAGEAGSRGKCVIAHGEELGPVVDEMSGAVASGGAASAAAAGFFEKGAGELPTGGESCGAGRAGDAGSDDGDARVVHAGGTFLAEGWREKCALGAAGMGGRSSGG